MSKSIDIVIDESGEIKIETNGYVGEECMDVLAKLEEIIGEATDTTDKPERFQKAQITDRNKQNLGG